MGHLTTASKDGASIITIHQACDASQILVSLSKNNTHWLSPIGWTDQQKVTLLDCRPKGSHTEIDIPVEFARQINSGDILVLRCSELDLEQEIIWEKSDIQTRQSDEQKPVATGFAGALISRFKTKPSETEQDIKTEAEKRAEDAHRAAQTYKAKMEAATAAKEEAHRKALEAAREAEAALKAEADRIAEMERAAKAFEDAERLKQDELRRVEEERRLEEARVAEEARKAEEARLRELAAKEEAKRIATLERYEAALNTTRDEEKRLKSRLKTLKSQAKTDAANRAVQLDDLESRKSYLVITEEAAAEKVQGLKTSVITRDAAAAELSGLQKESGRLISERETIAAKLSQSDTAYQQAQRVAEAAIAKAEQLRSQLEALRQEDAQLSTRIAETSEDLSAKALAAEDSARKATALEQQSEMAQAELAQAKTEIESIEQSLTAQEEKEQPLQLEMEATRQAIEDANTREVHHQAAIEHLRAGGSVDEVEALVIQDVPSAPMSLAVDSLTDKAAIIEPSTLKGKTFGRVRRKFARTNEAQISVAVEDVILDAPTPEADSVLLARVDDTPSFLRRHGSSLMAMGAVIGGIAILGGGYALNKSAAPKLEVKSITPAPTQVASAVEKVELPTLTDIPVLETVELEAESVIEEAVSPAEPDAEAFVIKLAEVVDPTGFAFELPDMRPVSQPEIVTAKAKAVKQPTSKKSKAKAPETAKKAEVTKPIVKSVSKVEAEVNYPELTSDIQTRLQNLGFYNGDINGVQTRDTKDAITNFKALFSMPVDDKITGALLTQLKRAERDQEAALNLQAAQAEAQAQTQTQAQTKAQATIQVAEAAPIVEFYDTVEAVPSTPVLTDSLPATSSVISPSPAPSYIEPEPMQFASIPAVVDPAPTPVVQDVIVEAKMLKNASPEYPTLAVRRDYFANVAIEVAYSVDASGGVTNVRVVSNDNDAKYKDAFEKEAMKAIKKMRYEPKTVNGVAMESAGQKKRIVFRGE